MSINSIQSLLCNQASGPYTHIYLQSHNIQYTCEVKVISKVLFKQNGNQQYMFITQHRSSTYAHKTYFFYQMVCLWNIKATILIHTLNMCLSILPMNHQPTPLKALLKGVKVIISFLKGMKNIHRTISYSSFIGWTHQPMKLLSFLMTDSVHKCHIYTYYEYVNGRTRDAGRWMTDGGRSQ